MIFKKYKMIINGIGLIALIGGYYYIGAQNSLIKEQKEIMNSLSAKVETLSKTIEMYKKVDEEKEKRIMEIDQEVKTLEDRLLIENSKRQDFTEKYIRETTEENNTILSKEAIDALNSF